MAELMPRIGLPLINIVDATAAELRARKIRRVALFGSIFTMPLRPLRDGTIPPGAGP
jgi:aspartate racemase